MADERNEGQEKTEAPTPRRRDEARREGKAPKSVELAGATAMLVGAVALAGFGGTAAAGAAFQAMQVAANALTFGPLGIEGASQLLFQFGGATLLAILPFAVGVAGAGAGAQLAQTGGLFSTKSIEPKLSHLNPLSGFKRLFNTDALATLVKSVLKVGLIGLVLGITLLRSWNDLVGLSALDPAELALVQRDLLFRLALASGVAYLLVALADAAFQRFKFEKSLRMSRQELVQENRESEGDPILKARMRSIARQRARSRMIADVPTADVVVVNPVHIAVALRYDAGGAGAPVVVALGRRKLAERIKDVARQAGVPVVENIPVARALVAGAKVGQAIPPALYAAIAEILAFVYRQRAAAGRGLPGSLRSIA